MMKTKRVVLALLLLTGLSWRWSGTARGQEEPIQAPGVEESSPSIFIPYDKLEEVFGAEGAAAILPYADIQKLMKLLEDQRPAVPGAMVTQADYAMTVEKDHARVKATLSVKSLKDGWTSVRLPLKGAAVGKVTIDNDEAVFRGAADNQYLLQLPAKGNYQVTLDLLVKIQSSPDRRLFAFQTPLSGITTAQITVPTADQEITVKPEAVQLPVEAAEGQSSVKVNLGATERIEVSWTPEASAKPQMELLTSVQNQTLITLGDGLVHMEADLEIDVLRGELTELQILVPKSHRILGVTSGMVNVQSQTVEETDQAKIITIKLLQAISKRFPIEVHTEQALPDEHFPLAGTDEEGNVYGIHVRGAIRESGTVSIAHSSETRLVVDQQEGVMRVDGASVPEAIRNRATVHYRFYSPNFTLVGGIEPVEPRVQVTQAVTHTFQKGALKVDAQLSYQVERAGVFELTLKLPAELTVDSVRADHLREFTIDDATGVMTVSFNQKVMGAVQVRIFGKVTLGEDEEQQLALPVPEPENVFQETGTIAVYAPVSLEIDTVEEETSGVIPQDVAAQAQQNNQARLVAQWSYQSRPIAITVRTVRKPTRLSARLETLVDVNEDQTSVRTRIRYQIEHAPLRFFQIDVPEAVSEKVTIEVPDGMGQAIQSKTPAEEAVDGWVRWTIELQQEALGEQAFDVIFEEPLEREGDEQLSEIEVTLPKALPALTAAEGGEEIPLVRTVGEIGIARDRSLTLSSSIDTERSESLDRRELTMPAGASDQAYRYYTQPVTLTLRSRKYEIQTVVETVISKALVEVAVGYDPQATYRCRYLLNSSERQRLLVRLPKNSEPLSVLVDGRRVDLEQAEEEESSEQWDAYYVNVSQSNSANEQFSLTLQFLWPINPPQFRALLGTLQLPFPQISSLKGDAATQQLRLAIWVPDKFHLVGTPDKFNDDAPVNISAALFGFPSSPPVSTDELNNWIGNAPTGAIEFPAEGMGYSFQTMGDLDATKVSWWKMYWMVWVLSASIFVIGWLLKNTSWENRLGIVLLVIFLAAIYAVKDTDVVAHALAAARFGILAVIVLWMIQCAFSLRACLVPAAAGAGGETVTAAEPEAAEEAAADTAPEGTEQEETKPDEPPSEPPPDEPSS
jgi:hypothetical protein